MANPSSSARWSGHVGLDEIGTGNGSRKGNRSRGSPPGQEALVIASPYRDQAEQGLSHWRSGGQQAMMAAATPCFELSSDPLDGLPTTFASQNVHTNRRLSLTKIDINLANKEKERSINEATTKRPISPHVSIATPTSSSSARYSHSTSPHNRRPSSGLIRTSSPSNLHTSSARSHVAAHGTPIRQNSLGKAAAHAAQTLYDAVSGRSTPQPTAYIIARPDSTSGTSKRHVTSADTLNSEQQAASFPYSLDEMEDDDEQDKGHGNRRQSSGRWTPTILSSFRKRRDSPVSNNNPAVASRQAFSTTVAHTDPAELTEEEMQPSHRQAGVQGRKTPAKYRPSEDLERANMGVSYNRPADYYPPNSQISHRVTHPLSHAHKASISSTSNSSHSIQMNSPPLSMQSRHASLQTSPILSTHSRHPSMHAQFGSGLPGSTNMGTSVASLSSPLIVPQARRRAINLRPNSQKKKAALARRRKAAALAAEANKKPLRQQILEFSSLVVSVIRCPMETVQACQSHIQTSAKNFDSSFRDPRTGERVWKPSWLSAYIPLLVWLVVSLSSTIIILIWHTQVFQALDRLSIYLQDLGLVGRLALGFLIFLTTFPPLPLYSTLIILCGFSFGLLQGFIISYIAALSGAIVVFMLSRSFLKSWMVDLLNKSGGLKRVVRAIEKRPKLLFLVRLAPYPYNLMNTLLASSPTLTLKTYTLCTALALPKLLVHCALGTSIKNFAAYNGAVSVTQSPLGSEANDKSDNATGGDSQSMLGSGKAQDATASHTAETIKHIFGFVGLGLCIGIFIYLFSVARRAVDEELDEDDEGGAEEYDVVFSDEEGVDGEYDGEAEEGEERVQDSDSGSEHPALARESSESALDGKSYVANTPWKAGHMLENQLTPRHFDDQNNPYFTQGLSSYSASRNNRRLESQISLADSIVEMEKHAMELEQEPLFQRISVDDSASSSSHH
ncbi:hypothetical protein CBS101457_001223 [Exobasidium rhododendri]|nr:hypothetical protein CBS101457_001223 [Exobasidium rhododendri]